MNPEDVVSYETHFWGQNQIVPPLTNVERAEFNARMREDWARSLQTLTATHRPVAPCRWAVTEDGDALIWDECAKFYDFDRLMRVLIAEFFAPRGHVLNGEMRYSGEADSDEGVLRVVQGKVTMEPLEMSW